MGYDGYSMSYRARDCYDLNILPMSKWKKSTFIEVLSEYENINIKKVKRANLFTLKKLLKYDSWHHVGACYKEIDFYRISDEKLNNWIEKGYPVEKEETEETEDDLKICLYKINKPIYFNKRFIENFIEIGYGFVKGAYIYPVQNYSNDVYEEKSKYLLRNSHLIYQYFNSFEELKKSKELKDYKLDKRAFNKACKNLKKYEVCRLKIISAYVQCAQKKFLKIRILNNHSIKIEGLKIDFNKVELPFIVEVEGEKILIEKGNRFIVFRSKLTSGKFSNSFSGGVSLTKGEVIPC